MNSLFDLESHKARQKVTCFNLIINKFCVQANFPNKHPLCHIEHREKTYHKNPTKILQRPNIPYVLNVLGTTTNLHLVKFLKHSEISFQIVRRQVIVFIVYIRTRWTTFHTLPTHNKRHSNKEYIS